MAIKDLNIMRLSCHCICENLIIVGLCGRGNVKILLFRHSNVKISKTYLIFLLYVYNVLLTLKLFYCTICCPYNERSYYVYAFMDEWRSNFCQSNVNLFISCLYCHDDLFLERVGYLQIITIVLFYPKYNNLIRKKGFMIPQK